MPTSRPSPFLSPPHPTPTLPWNPTPTLAQSGPGTPPPSAPAPQVPAWARPLKVSLSQSQAYSQAHLGKPIRVMHIESAFIGAAYLFEGGGGGGGAKCRNRVSLVPAWARPLKVSPSLAYQGKKNKSNSYRICIILAHAGSGVARITESRNECMVRILLAHAGSGEFITPPNCILGLHIMVWGPEMPEKCNWASDSFC